MANLVPALRNGLEWGLEFVALSIFATIIGETRGASLEVGLPIYM